MSYDSRPARRAVIHDHCVARSSAPQSRAGSRAATAAASRAFASAGVLHPRCRQAESRSTGSASRMAMRMILKGDRVFTGAGRSIEWFLQAKLMPAGPARNRCSVICGSERRASRARRCRRCSDLDTAVCLSSDPRGDFLGLGGIPLGPSSCLCSQA